MIDEQLLPTAPKQWDGPRPAEHFKTTFVDADADLNTPHIVDDINPHSSPAEILEAVYDSDAFTGAAEYSEDDVPGFIEVHNERVTRKELRKIREKQPQTDEKIVMFSAWLVSANAIQTVSC